MDEYNIPAIAATIRATHGVHEPNYEANAKLKTAEAKAPITIVPSRPIFTIPLRSEKIPPKAVKISGVE